MLIYERALLIRMAFDTSRIDSDRELSLLCFKAAVSVVTVAAGHSSLKHFVMEGLAELRFRFTMTADTELWLALSEHYRIDLIWFLLRRRTNERNRLRFKILRTGSVRRVAIGAADIVAPVNTAPKIVVAFPAGMAS